MKKKKTHTLRTARPNGSIGTCQMNYVCIHTNISRHTLISLQFTSTHNKKKIQMFSTITSTWHDCGMLHEKCICIPANIPVFKTKKYNYTRQKIKEIARSMPMSLHVTQPTFMYVLINTHTLRYTHPTVVSSISEVMYVLINVDACHTNYVLTNYTNYSYTQMYSPKHLRVKKPHPLSHTTYPLRDCVCGIL